MDSGDASNDYFDVGSGLSSRVGSEADNSCGANRVDSTTGVVTVHEDFLAGREARHNGEADTGQGSGTTFCLRESVTGSQLTGQRIIPAPGCSRLLPGSVEICGLDLDRRRLVITPMRPTAIVHTFR